MSNRNFLNFLLPFVEVKFTHSEFLQEDGTMKPTLIIDPEDGGRLSNHKVVLKKWCEDLESKAPGLASDVLKHTGKSMYMSMKRIKIFSMLMYAVDKITAVEVLSCILDNVPKAEMLIPKYNSDSFVDELFDTYKIIETAKGNSMNYETPTSTVLEIGAISPETRKTLNSLLPNMGLPEWDKIEGSILTANGSIAALSGQLETEGAANKKLMSAANRANKALSKVVADLTAKITLKPFKDVAATSDGIIPNGKVVLKSIKDVFSIDTKADFQVPVWEWDGIHPDIPAIDPNYIFREELLVRSLYAIVSNQRMYLQGHTGTGKTTLVEQIAARLNWPFMRINFDSEITRMDLIGRDTLKDGKSVFVDGVLPRMMQSNYIGVFDEIDFCRPDVAYVMQSVLEGNAFRITEDGGRLVEPNPMFRMFATGNTVGQGDEHGMYQGARPQSLALLDRFTVWAKVEYLPENERLTLLSNHVPSLMEEELTIISKYTTEHLVAFQNSKILQPISPRGMIAIGKAVSHLNSIYIGGKSNISKALSMVVLDRASESDYAVIKGIIDRVTK